MTKLNKEFNAFKSNIEPDIKAVEYAVDAHTRVRNCLEQDEEFAEFFDDTFLYGSYKRHTAVGGIKDVDIVVLTKFDPSNPEHTPNFVLRRLKAALARCYDTPDFLEYQRRSIRVDDPLPDEDDAELTLDVIPAVAVNGNYEPLLVPDKIQKEWIWSHPRGHLGYTTYLNSDDHGKGKYVPLVKMIKWWWKYQCELHQPDVERPKPKGFWVECLTGIHFDKAKTDWADHFIAVLEGIVDAYADVEDPPELPDPGLQDETIKTNMTMGEFRIFLNIASISLDLARTARYEEDKLKSSEMWREIFGEEFPLYGGEEAVAETKALSIIRLGDTSHKQELRWPMASQSKYKVRINAYLYYNRYQKGGYNSNRRAIYPGFDIKYLAWTNVKRFDDIQWRIVNTGEHAHREDGLRGGFVSSSLLNGEPSLDKREHWEQTAYSGKHWIECFVIKDGVCVCRSSRFYVNLK